jgi:outer membrane protein assembly factor BamB
MGGVLHGVSTRTEFHEWTFLAGDEILSRPAIRSNLVYFGSNDGNVYALEAASGTMVWSFTTGGAVKGSPVFHRDDGTMRELLIIGSADKTLYALDLSPRLAPGRSRKVWEFKTGGEVSSTACVSGDSVYVTSTDGKLYCLAAVSGARKWAFTTGAKSLSGPTVSDGVVYFGGSDSHFYAVTTGTGKLLWKYEVTGEILGSPTVLGDHILVGTTGGKVYCFVKPK